jgi:primosomal protein N' (replication factor Y)
MGTFDGGGVINPQRDAHESTEFRVAIREVDRRLVFAYLPRAESRLLGAVIARVALDLALRKEFDYLVPPEWVDEVAVGRRVKVPFGTRELLGSIIALAEESPQTNLRPISKLLGSQPQFTPEILELARWIAGYYCCPLERALKSVLPDAVRKEQEGWRERLRVRALSIHKEAPKLTRRQQDVWNIIEEWRELPLQELLRLANTTAETVRRLEDKGLVTVATEIAERDPHREDQFVPTEPLVLNAEQSAAHGEIVAALEAGRGEGSGVSGSSGPTSRPRVFLLHGVTGSGKTEVYLQGIAHALRLGKSAIVLVPEISLTPQTVERFKARFHHGPLRTSVAVLHSHLSTGERHDEWQKIRHDRARIVIGARSAVFAPVDQLGLIIVDEEHETSYKQEEAPRYHARDVAIVRAQRAGAVVVLGSATPSLESYYHARQGKYRLLVLPQRADAARLPLVRVIDLRAQVRAGKGPPVFSHPLREAIRQRLEKREQIMLFLNRRGYATSLQCLRCGYVAGCPNCSVALTYHLHKQKICCHVCGHEEDAPILCPEPKCRHPGIRYSGLGTERVEEHLARTFPSARIARMDSDTLKRKDDYRRTLMDFRTGRIDILLGTQMIAKGLHFPNVTLVGIIYADLALHLPDFRAGERTFQLLTQVSGRAGRGDLEGEVVVQAFTPYHPAIQYARRHDYLGFYEQEIEFRQQLRYPPLTRAAMLTIRGRNEDKVRFSAEHLRGELAKSLVPVRDLIIAGPAPAPLLRAQTMYRYQIMLRSRAMARLAALLALALENCRLPADIRVIVDIDPVDLM